MKGSELNFGTKQSGQAEIDKQLDKLWLGWEDKFETQSLMCVPWEFEQSQEDLVGNLSSENYDILSYKDKKEVKSLNLELQKSEK